MKDGVNLLKGRLVIIEVMYGCDTSWKASEEANPEKYRPLVQKLEEVGWEVEFRVLFLGVTGISRDLFEEGQGRRFGITKGSCRQLELIIARSSWKYVRSMWVDICKAVAIIEAQLRAGGGEPDEHIYHSTVLTEH